MTIARNALLCGVLFFLTASGSRGLTADPPHYLKKATWHETMLASLEALERRGLEYGFAPFESGVLRGGDEPQRVSVDISGATELFLFVTGAPDKRWGVATWAGAKLVAPGGAGTTLSRFKGLKVLKGRHSVDINLHSGLYEKLRIAGRRFESGLHVQADSVARVTLDGEFARLEAWIGIDDWAGENGNVRFAVLGARDAARRMLWDLAARDFSEEAPRREMRWEKEDRILEKPWREGNLAGLAARYARACHRVPPLAATATEVASAAGRETLTEARRLYLASRRIDEALGRARAFNFRALELAIEDLRATYGDRYLEGPDYRERLADLKRRLPRLLAALEKDTLREFRRTERLARRLESLRREALLANPLLDFDRLLVVKRKPIGEPRRSQWGDRGLGEYLGMPRQSSWGVATIPRPTGWDNEIAVLSPVRPEGKLTTLFRPQNRELLLDVDLHFDAERLLFAMPDGQRRWQIYEIAGDGTGLRQITPGDQPEVDCYDACYVPDGRIVFISTAVLQGVPCNASVIVGMMYRMNPDGTDIHQVCFEQDHDYYPSVLNDGRVVYLRWDYTDTPHIWNRLLMAMNPDGSGQMEYYGRNSYWPNAIFFPRAIPDHPTKIAAIVTGHHESRDGELVIFDPARGRHETEGVVQRIPGYGKKVEAVVDDKPTEHSWPKFLHPWPLSEKYFIVSAKPTEDSLWGVYLVDVFDNMLLLKEEEHHVLLEPIPFRRRRSPPVIPDRSRRSADGALVHLIDVYEGPGLAGIPRGAVKKLRLFTYHFGYQTLAGIDHRIGADGPWEVKRVLGTVPVEEDGSAFFRIPAKTPISVQPLDSEGKALALMRSWMTAMPGETLSCVGCHDTQNGAPLNNQTLATNRPPSAIKPWYGPTRGFSFKREVQPVLDKYCVSCHDGKNAAGGASIPDLRGDRGGYVAFQRGNPVGTYVERVRREELFRRYGGVFEPSYIELVRFLRTGGLESDLHVLPPKEFHADTQELIQLLQKGHHSVDLDREAWDRLITWIDLNAPCHGSWRETTRLPGNQRERRRTLRRLYGGVDEDPEEIPELERVPIAPVVPEAIPKPEPEPVDCPRWPFDAEEARRRQVSAGTVTRTMDLGCGVKMDFVRIPAGSFVIGDPDGCSDEQPCARVEIARPFWMGRCEVTNEQFRRFDPSHDSRFEHRTSWIFSEAYLGWRLDGPKQPVVRVSWERAMAFCRWLSKRTGESVTLPTEAQWEYACRAGSAAPLSYGDLDTDFSGHANVADATIRELALEGWRPKSPDLVPRDGRFDDQMLVTAEVGRYQPNAWGLCDMHGNAAEWTRTAYRPYPYRVGDGRDLVSAPGQKAVRGGSWRDRPKRCRSAFRLSYPQYQRVYNVGFRVIVEGRTRVVRTAFESLSEE